MRKQDMGKGGAINILKTHCFLAILLCGALSAGAAGAASVFANDSCDPDYYQSLESRAWLEAQREVVQNQNLIFKPDSVLEYTCFDKHLNVLSQQSMSLLSGNPLFGGNPLDLGNALSSTVSGPLTTYITSNFAHTYLGGRSTLNYTPSPAVLPGSYTCSEMDKVWMAAKCMNFIDQSSHDGFFTFAEYVGTDFRTLPTACGSNGPFQANIDKALTETGTPWTEDKVNTYMTYIYPATGGTNACGDTHSMVPTGRIVKTDKYSSLNIKQYREQACLVSGCKYIPKSETEGCCTRGTACN
jgi:hypothetical protein